jgi:crotonobetainyl-CoA:carnitine CoA-transferase CaiB-like acyl-CoA transferase
MCSNRIGGDAAMSEETSDAGQGPLAGIRVIDFTSIYSGPIGTSILGDQGADVIKVEAADGDLMRRGKPAGRNVAASFAMMNRNKRSIVIDARTDAGREVLLDLIRDADVVVENFRPGVMDRLGIGYEHCRAANPKIIFASINGVGSTGPYSKRRVYDAVIQAVGGVAALQSDPATGRPQMINTLICDKITSLNAAQVVTAALFARERHGIGQRVELTMLDAALHFIWPDGMHNQSFLGDDVEPMPALDHSHFVRATADGYVAVMPVKAAELEGSFKALGLDALWGDPRFATPADRYRNAELLQGLLNDAYASFSTEDICARLEANDVPFAKINGRDDVVKDPQVKAMGALLEVAHPQGGRMRQPRPPGQFSQTPAGLMRCSPELGEHTKEVLREIRSDAEIEALLNGGIIH